MMKKMNKKKKTVKMIPRQVVLKLRQKKHLYSGIPSPAKKSTHKCNVAHARNNSVEVVVGGVHKDVAQCLRF